MGNKTFKAQSAMEYLMTYGWAILIIAVVLAALFSLGVFSGSSLVGTACVASPGYLCENPVLGGTGDLAFTFGQNTGSTIYGVNMACAATSTSLGEPSNTGSSAVWYVISGSGGSTASSGTANTGTSLASGQTIGLTALPCVGNTGALLSSPAVGTAFSGFLWLNYTTTNLGSTYYTVKVATLSLKVV